MQTFSPKSRRSRLVAGLLLLLVTGAALAVVMIPAMVIHPFKPQSPRGLEISYLLKSWSPIVTVVCAALVLALLVWLWRSVRWWSKALLVIALLLTSVTVWFARQNHFEWMFAPISQIAHASAEDAKFIEEGDKVLAVEIGGEAVAYPVRQLAYHHIVQDTVGGVPIAATY